MKMEHMTETYLKIGFLKNAFGGSGGEKLLGEYPQKEITSLLHMGSNILQSSNPYHLQKLYWKPLSVRLVIGAGKLDHALFTLESLLNLMAA